MIDINSLQILNCLLYSVSIITFLLVLLLLYVEFNYYMYPGYKFRFTPDSEFTAKLKLNVDLTVAMPCDCKSIHSFYYSFFIYLFNLIWWHSDWSWHIGQDWTERLQLRTPERGAHMVGAGLQSEVNWHLTRCQLISSQVSICAIHF